ncbi:hypothetical protein RA27_22075 [Ruegeria sp. ANG-R]|nr:hypothetical protein RA27_22075 [Ruegeria sp. ANG-R]
MRKDQDQAQITIPNYFFGYSPVAGRFVHEIFVKTPEFGGFLALPSDLPQAATSAGKQSR